MNIAFQRRKEVGIPPGTLAYTGTTEIRETRITLTAYDQHEIVIHTPDSAEQCAAFHDSPGVHWINVDGLHDVDTLRELGRLFGIHSLVLEDIVSTHQRPRVQAYDNYFYIVLKMLHTPHDTDSQITTDVEEEQISIVVGTNYVITFQEKPGDPFDPIRARLQAGAGRIRRMGADYLAYALIDTIVDGFFPIIEDFGEYLISLESGVIESPAVDQLHAVYNAKRFLIALRRHIWPLREVVNGLVRGDAGNNGDTLLITETTTIYLRDVYDHVIHIIEILESYREMVAALVDLFMSSQSNRMNEVMKVLTIIATIFIPLTFIAGIYGMNFDPDASPFNMPELAWYWGYPVSLLVMLVIAAGMLFFFRRKKWL